LQQRVELQEALNAEKFAGLDRSIDRFLGKRQVEQGGGQVRLALVAILLAVIALVASLAIGFGFIKPL
jgi:hypothetical protein